MIRLATFIVAVVVITGGGRGEDCGSGGRGLLVACCYHLVIAMAAVLALTAIFQSAADVETVTVDTPSTAALLLLL